MSGLKLTATVATSDCKIILLNTSPIAMTKYKVKYKLVSGS